MQPRPGVVAQAGGVEDTHHHQATSQWLQNALLRRQKATVMKVDEDAGDVTGIARGAGGN